jgi:hypothetical protein
MLQDPTEQVDIDNFMVQQLDGTSNEWGSVQSRSYGEEDSSLPGQMSPLTTMIYYYVKFRGCTESSLICSTLQTLLETKLWCCLCLLLM